MKLQPTPGQSSPRGMRGALVFAHRKTGGVVVSTWPRSRGSLLTPIQQQQVGQWDSVMAMIKIADPIDVTQAQSDTKGTAYYVRDVLSQCAWGAYVSWPGFGPYPLGGPTGPIPMPRNQRTERGQARLGNPQAVNVVAKTEWQVSPFGTTIALTTVHPSNPKLFVWDIQPVRIEVPVKRKNKKVNHGKKPFFPQDPLIVSPDSISGNTATFAWPQRGPSGQAGITYYALAQLGSDSKTKVSFSSTARAVNDLWLVVDLVLVGSAAEDGNPFPLLDFAPANVGDLASSMGWPAAAIVDVAYDNFPGGLAPDGPGNRRTYIVNLSTAAPAYTFDRGSFPLTSGAPVQAPNLRFSLDLPSLPPGTAGSIKVRGYRGCSDFIIGTGFQTQPVGGTLLFAATDSVSAPSSGSVIAEWLVGRTGIIARAVEVFP